MLYRWSDVVSGEVQENLDARFEVACVLMNLGEWHRKRAAMLAKNSAGDEEAAKEIFRCLKQAASMYGYINQNLAKAVDYLPNTGVCVATWSYTELA